MQVQMIKRWKDANNSICYLLQSFVVLLQSGLNTVSSFIIQKNKVEQKLVSHSCPPHEKASGS